MGKLSLKILPLCYEQSSGGSGEVCNGFTSHSSSTSCDIARAKAVGRAQLITCTAFKSTKPASGLLNTEVGNCTRKVCDMKMLHTDLTSLYSILQLTTSSDSDHHDLSPQMTVPSTSYSTNSSSGSHFQPHFSVTALDSSTP